MPDPGMWAKIAGRAPAPPAVPRPQAAVHFVAQLELPLANAEIPLSPAEWADVQIIEAAMNRTQWTKLENWGPSVQIKTRIAWENPSCRRLYMYLKGKYDDRIIPCERKPPLYYYFGAIGHWGKAGFRISGHTKTRAKIKNNCHTYGILHVEN